VSLGDTELKKLVLKSELVTEEEQKDLDRLGIAKNSREEKTRARDSKMAQDAAHNERMAKLYREVVLKEKQPEGFVPLSAVAATLKANGNGSNAGSSKPEVVEPVMGD
jgi:hypothetical protein